MHVGNQVKSLHYFHSYVVHDHIDVSDLLDDQPNVDIQSLPVTTFVPSVDDCIALRSNYIVHVARIFVLTSLACVSVLCSTTLIAIPKPWNISQKL